MLTRHTVTSEPGVQFITGDLLTGAGVDEAVQGVDAIVHCAGNFKGDAAMTRTLVRGGSRKPAHRTSCSSPWSAPTASPSSASARLTFAYFRAKREAEDVIVAASGLPWTTLRATQFYDLFLIVGKAVAKLPACTVCGGFSLSAGRGRRGGGQARGARARSSLPGLVPDLGGPRVYRMSDLVRSYLRAVHRRRLLLPLWIPGKSARVVRAGGNLVAPAMPAARRESGRGRSSSLARTGAPTPAAPSSRRAATR